jgi:hypothetical protein
VIATAPACLAADSDGDGVDDSIDCRPADATTWSGSTQARGLTVTGGSMTSFSWLPPTPDPGQTVYDVLRRNGPAGWGSAVCLLSNTSSLSANNLDPAMPFSNIFFYLVRAKTTCGGQLGENSSGIPIFGTNCSANNGAACSVSAACNSHYCCTGSCRDVTADVQNCGACGNVCTAQNAVSTCTEATCGFTCNPGFMDCDGLASDGCETNVSNNPSDCGNCNVACSVANGTPGCTGGNCVIFSCNPPFGNCNGSYADGCETNTSNTVSHCGACGNVCPGFGQSTADVACSASSCTLSCKGENYDVDNNPPNGCEFVDAPLGNHTSGSALSLGSHDCFDNNFSYSGTILSDSRTHANPAVTGFDGTTGSAPDWHTTTATGGPFCTNDLSFTLTTSGGGPSACYRLTIFTNALPGGVGCTTTGAGVCSVTRPSGSYSDNSTVGFRVDKTCRSSTRERVTYGVQGHL